MGQDDSCNLPVTRIRSGFVQYCYRDYRDYRTMRQPGRRMSDPSDPRASPWLTRICGLGQRVAFASKGTPAEIIQQMNDGPRHRTQRREELTACRKIQYILTMKVSGEDDILWRRALGCESVTESFLTRHTGWIDFVFSRTEAISLLRQM